MNKEMWSQVREMVEISLRENAKIVITEHGISPTLLLGSLPVSMKSEKNAKKAFEKASKKLNK